MALFIKMKSGARHFGKGDKAPSLLNLYFDTWWNPFCWSGWWFPADYLGGPRLQLRLGEVESVTFLENEEVDRLIQDLQRQGQRVKA